VVLALIILHYKMFFVIELQKGLEFGCILWNDLSGVYENW